VSRVLSTKAFDISTISIDCQCAAVIFLYIYRPDVSETYDIVFPEVWILQFVLSLSISSSDAEGFFDGIRIRENPENWNSVYYINIERLWVRHQNISSRGWEYSRDRMFNDLRTSDLYLLYYIIILYYLYLLYFACNHKIWLWNVKFQNVFAKIPCFAIGIQPWAKRRSG